jgi:hypothetical protein
MVVESILSLLQALGSRNVKVANNGWVHASCPMAPYSPNHKSKEDAHPSFGIAINPKKRSGYRCFTCGAKGNVTELMHRLNALAREAGDAPVCSTELFNWLRNTDTDIEETPDELMAMLDSAAYRPRKSVEFAGVRVSEDAAKRMQGYVEQEEVILTDADLDAFAPLSQEAAEYLMQDRGLSDDTIVRWDFRWNPKTRRVVIPIRDCKGRLVGYSNRAIDQGVKPKFLHSKGYLRDRYLYGEHFLREGGTKQGVVVEGFFDAIHLWQHGYQGVAMLGTYPSKMQVEKMVRFFGEIVILPDGDAAGYEAADRVMQALKGRVPTRIAKVPHGRDPDELSPLDLAEILG